MHRLETVAHVGQRPADDDRHGVVEKGLLHLGLNLDGLDALAAEVDQLDRHHEIFGNAILGSRLVVLWLDWRFI